MAHLLRGTSRSRAGVRSAKAHIHTPLPSASSRRVVVKVRVVQVGAASGKKAAKLHLAYVQRDGVERDGSPGALYGAAGRTESNDFQQDLPGEKHQFRIVVSPEDAQELDLEAFVRTYMQRVERDLGQKLSWAAVNHYNTDNPHAHIVIRGIDADGQEVRIDREYVSHGLRYRAEELVTEELGPRPERSRVELLKRQAELERYTSLDRALERRAARGVVEGSAGKPRDPHFEAALKTRLEVLEKLGLARRAGRAAWRLNPELRSELQHMARRAEALAVIRSVVELRSSTQCRVIDRAEPRHELRAELERGVQGILRWKGLDEQGQFCAVVETTQGEAYHLPVSHRVAAEVRVGQVVDLKRALDKDRRIEEVARQHGGICDLKSAPQVAREAFRTRLEQLERMQLATRESQDRWRLREDFRADLAKGKQQPYWQMLALRADPQRISDQIPYGGHVWLDRVRVDQLGDTGFGAEVQRALRLRYDYLRGLGLTPQAPKLRWQLRDLQQQRLERSVAAARGSVAARPKDGFEGVVHVHREANGERFVEIRAAGRFAIRPAARDTEALEGRYVRVRLDPQGRVKLEQVDRGPQRSR